MGVWSAPNKKINAQALLELVADPIPAKGASDALWDVAGSDTMMDMVERAKKVSPEVDVRPLIALELDMILNWARREDYVEGWEEGAESLAEKALAACIQAAEGSDLIAQISDLKNELAAKKQVAMILGIKESEAAGLQSEPGTVPGVVIIHHEGFDYRVEPIWGTVHRTSAPVAEPDALRP